MAVKCNVLIAPPNSEYLHKEGAEAYIAILDVFPILKFYSFKSERSGRYVTCQFCHSVHSNSLYMCKVTTLSCLPRTLSLINKLGPDHRKLISSSPF